MKAKRLEIRLTDELFDKVKKRADDLGVTVSAYIHLVLPKDLKEGK